MIVQEQNKLRNSAIRLFTCSIPPQPSPVRSTISMIMICHRYSFGFSSVTGSTLRLSSLFRLIVGVIVSFVVVMMTFATMIFYYELVIKHRQEYHEKYRRRFQTFQVN